MKKILLMLSLVAGAFTVSNAQIKVPTTGDITKNFIAPPAIGDVGKTSKGIVDELTKTLGLDGGQSKSTLDEVTKFLGSKSDFLGLGKTNPSEYLKKFNPLQKGLFGKLNTIMGATKYAKFLGLKPAKAGSLLSNLFF